MYIKARVKEKTSVGKLSKVVYLIVALLGVIGLVFSLKDVLKATVYESWVLRTQLKSFGIAGVDRDISVKHILVSLGRNVGESFGPKIAFDDFIIDIKFEELMVLNQAREDALLEGKLNKSHFDYVKSKIRVDGEKVKAKVRLKGWNLDHVATDKWSLRVKTKGQTPLGIKEFSLNGPFTRDFHTAMLINKAMRHRGVLATREKFYDVTINGNEIGNMYFEEGYGEQFTEYSRTPYGPILKFDEKSKSMSFEDEDSFWVNDPNLNLIGSKMDGILESPSSFQHLIDFEKWAEYLAVVFVFKCWHGNIDMNLSFYFHPLQRALQPISSDNSCGQTDPGRLFGVLPYQGEFVYDLLNIPSFSQLLVTKIEWWIDSKDAKILLSELRDNEKTLRKALATESPFLAKFNISVDHLPGIIDWLKSERPPMKRLNVGDLGGSGIEVAQSSFPVVEVKRVYDNFKVNIQDYSEDRYVVDELILKSDVETKAIDLTGDSDYVSQKFNITYRDYFSSGDVKATFTYRDLNKPEILRSSGVHLSYAESDYVNFAETSLDEISKYFKLDASTKTFSSHSGDVIDIADTLVLPQGYSLRLSPGTKVTLGLDAGLVVKGALQIQGSKDQVVSLSGKNNDRWGGILVASNQHPVVIDYMLMTGGTGVIKGFPHRGAFTVNNAKVSITNSIFQNNQSEDALNLVQVSGVLDGLIIQDTPSDGLDVDYGDVQLSNSLFLNIGSASGADAIDVSKTTIDISNVSIDNVTDKGISIGEGSRGIVHSSAISNALVGVVAKDSSDLSVNGLRLTGITFADTMSYRKKDHFKGSKISASKVVGGIGVSVAQKGSSISLNGVDLKPIEVDISELYASTMRSIKK